MKKFITRLFDSRDRAVEAHLVMLCCGVAAFIALSVYHVMILHRLFDAAAYGQGFGCLLAGGGAASWGQGMQRKVEAVREDEDINESAQ